MKLFSIENHNVALFRRIRLGVSSDDMIMMLKADEEVKPFLLKYQNA
jgi:hypothetical protein